MEENFGVQLFRVTVYRRVGVAVEDFLLQAEKGQETGQTAVLRALLTEQLAAAVEEIVGVFEQTVAEYEGRVERAEREGRLFEAALKPRVRLYRVDSQQQKMMIKEEDPPEQQQRSPSVDQDDSGPPFFKEEPNDVLISQVGQQRQGSEETDTRLTSTPVAVKSEEGEEKPLSAPLDPTAKYFQPEPEEKMESSHEPGTDSEEGVRQETREHQARVNTGSNNPTAGVTTGAADRERITSPACQQRSQETGRLQEHMSIHTEERPCRAPEGDDGHEKEMKRPTSDQVREKPFACPECGKGFIHERRMTRHVLRHASEKQFRCPECEQVFKSNRAMSHHMLIHASEHPFCCTECGKRFKKKDYLSVHTLIHTGERRHGCPHCGKSFTQKSTLDRHVVIHTGEMHHDCSHCGESFKLKSLLSRHMWIHIREQSLS